MSMKGMRGKTRHLENSALVCRSGRDRGTLGKKVYEVGVKAKLYMESLGKLYDAGIEQKHR